MAHARLLWAGLDTGADSSRLCIVDQDLCPVLEETLPSDPNVIGERLGAVAENGVEEVAVEAGSTSIHLAHGLRAQGYRVSILQTGQVARFLRLRRNKTDSSDARGLAELARLRLPSIRQVHLKSPEIQRMRTRLQFRHRLIIQRVACENMIRSIFRLHGGRLKRPQSSTQIVRTVLKETDRLRTERGIDLSEDVKPLVELAASMRRYLENIDADLAAWAGGNRVCTLLMGIPGVGPLTAVSFYTAIEDPWRFERATDVGAYLGLTPIVSQSGAGLRHGRISRMGSRLTRAHLVCAATGLFASRTSDCPLNGWGRAVAARAGAAKARIAVARRLAVLMLAIWKSGRPYDSRLAAPKVHANDAPHETGGRSNPGSSHEAPTSFKRIGRPVEQVACAGPDFEISHEA